MSVLLSNAVVKHSRQALDSIEVFTIVRLFNNRFELGRHKTESESLRKTIAFKQVHF